MDEYSDGWKTVTKEEYDEVKAKADRIVTKKGYMKDEKWNFLFGDGFEVYDGEYYDRICPTVRFSDYGKKYIYDNLNQTVLCHWLRDFDSVQWGEMNIWNFINSPYSSTRLNAKVLLKNTADGLFSIVGGLYLDVTVHRGGWVSVDVHSEEERLVHNFMEFVIDDDGFRQIRGAGLAD